MIPHKKGRAGEAKAAAYLESRGYTVLEKNFRKSFGETDIIAVKDCKIVFFEVKNWDAIGWEDLHRSIDDRKIRRMQELAVLYIQENPQYKNYAMGFDLVLLSGRMKVLDHIEDFMN